LHRGRASELHLASPGLKTDNFVAEVLGNLAACRFQQV
jgi:hypothetical protein